jgi:hypothetical protein
MGESYFAPTELVSWRSGRYYKHPAPTELNGRDGLYEILRLRLRTQQHTKRSTTQNPQVQLASVSRFGFVLSSVGIRTIHEITRNRRNKARSAWCDFVDRLYLARQFSIQGH